MLPQSSEKMPAADLNLNGFSDEIEVYLSHLSGNRFVLKGRDGLDQRLIYKVENHLSKDFYQGIGVVRPVKDFNQDQLPDLLLGTYQVSGRQLKLVGFDVICQRTGNILIRYLPRTENLTKSHH